MVKIELLIEEGKASKIGELEKGRYINFLESSYKDNLEHSKSNARGFPRWAIISGYYAMHDITKLLIAKRIGLKIEYEVHVTTIKILSELIKNRSLIGMIERGYNEFLSLAQDLNEAKKERVKVQYYTGTHFMKSEYEKRAAEFLESVVMKYIERIKELMK